MATEWHRYEVSQLILEGKLVVGDGYRAKNEELASEGLPFARAGNINSGFHFDGADCFPLGSLSRVGNKISQTGDVVFTSKGTVGRFALVQADIPQFVYSPQLCFWRSLDHDFLLPRYLYYWMHSREFFLQFSGVAGQTDMAEYVSLSDQRRMHITLPGGREQSWIAQILGALDDKIELNGRTNQTLEAIARAIFKSWFVDFDPVRAKMDGRQPFGMDAETAALFPESLRLSELGPIPEGWEVAPLTAQIELLSGGTPSTSIPEYWNGPIPWVSVADAAPGPYIVVTEKSVTDVGVANSATRILPAGTLVVSARGTVGNCAIMAVPMAMNQSCYGLTGKDTAGPIFLLHLIREQVTRLKASAHGSPLCL